MNMMRVKSFTRSVPPPVVTEGPAKSPDESPNDANGNRSSDPKSDSPRQPTISAYSEAAVTETMILDSLAESAHQHQHQRTQTETSLEPSPPKASPRPRKRFVSSSPTASKSASARRSSAPTRFFQKVMRGQFSSDADKATASGATQKAAPAKWSKRGDASEDHEHERERLDGAAAPGSAQAEEQDGDDDDDDDNDDVLQASAPRLDGPAAAAGPGSTSSGHDTVYATLGDVFLNSSLQMLQVQSEAKQRVRQLWATTQRLRVENQLSDAALEALHQELLSVMKGLMIEKLEGARHVKSGYLTLVQAPPSLLLASGPLARRGAAAGARSLLFGPGKASLEQRVWASLSDEQCRLEIVPARDDASDHVAGPSSLPPLSGSPAATFPGLGRFKLPTTISWLLSDPVHPPSAAASASEDAAIARTTLRLQGCQVRRMPIIAGTGLEATRPRFQVLVPTRDGGSNIANGGGAGGGPHDASAGPPAVIVPEPPTLHSSFAIYVFEVNESQDADANERDANDWVAAIDRVCLFQLYMLELALREAPYMLQFRGLLEQHFPVAIPLNWLRNRLERAPPPLTSNGAPPTGQQRAVFQQQQLQRRSSRNLSMVQIIKDLERDRILIDQQLLIASAAASPSPSPSPSPRPLSPSPAENASSGGGGRTKRENDNIAEIVKYLVAKAMAFARRSADAARARSSTAAAGSPGSPSNRLTKLTEAKALAFIERVLRGSSRTQSGGDIYDAISFFCQQRHLSICPVSQDANPVVMNVVEDEENAAFHVHIEVTMQFKIVELGGLAPPPPPRARHLPRVDQAALDVVASSPREWAIMEGTLTRQFTLGKTSEPGTVTIRYIPSPDDCLNAEAAGQASVSHSD
ncbi:hypothetical protein P43SY_008067 [Pythium insidiosum]|uniref:PH domain-containing protein n=1 Tax=Pythium insidiosum TaxID=114742 RepID=A0AAD5LLL0_PYTIN|nr:hypothetical protein P43SY_008067 [Pythium insidiosum]